MKNLFVFIFVVLAGSFASAECPLTVGEVNECDLEQAIVESALSGLSIQAVHSYCFKAGFDGDGEGIQCRGPAMYQDANGDFSDVIFEDRFMSSEIDRFTAARIYFVKNSNGKYNIYTDTTTDGVLNIDQHVTDNVDVEVSFDASYENVPTFTTKFFTAGTNPPELNLNTLTHTPQYADLIDGITGDLIKRYYVVNPPQRVQN